MDPCNERRVCGRLFAQQHPGVFPEWEVDFASVDRVSALLSADGWGFQAESCAGQLKQIDKPIYSVTRCTTTRLRPCSLA
jgi:hypothetical protein